MKKLTAIACGFRISKGQQLTNWEADELTEKQQKYAATDAWTALKIFENFRDRVHASGNKHFAGGRGMGYVYLKNGNLEMADYCFEKALERINSRIERTRSTYSIFTRASVFASLGMKEEAMKDLREYRDLEGIHYFNLNWLKQSPLYDNLRDDPEFQQILHSIEAKCQAEHERVRQWLEENNML